MHGFLFYIPLGKFIPCICLWCKPGVIKQASLIALVPDTCSVGMVLGKVQFTVTVSLFVSVLDFISIVTENLAIHKLVRRFSKSTQILMFLIMRCKRFGNHLSQIEKVKMLTLATASLEKFPHPCSLECSAYRRVLSRITKKDTLARV